MDIVISKYVDATDNHSLFQLDRVAEDDPMDVYIVSAIFELFTATEEWNESEELLEEDENFAKIGSLSGYLVLGEQMLIDGYDPYEICDDFSGDLEFMASALDEIEEFGGNVFYIHELSIEEEYQGVGIGSIELRVRCC